MQSRVIGDCAVHPFESRVARKILGYSLCLLINLPARSPICLPFNPVPSISRPGYALSYYLTNKWSLRDLVLRGST